MFHQSKCKRKDQKTVSFITNFLITFGQSFLIFFVISLLSIVRENLGNDQSLGRIIAFGLFASLAMMAIHFANPNAYDQILFGIGVYFGFELLRRR